MQLGVADTNVTVGLICATTLRALWLLAKYRSARTCSPQKKKAVGVRDMMPRRALFSWARLEPLVTAAVLHCTAYFLCTTAVATVVLCMSALALRDELLRRSLRRAATALLVVFAALTVCADRQHLLIPSVRGKVIVVHSKADLQRNLPWVLFPALRSLAPLKYTAGLLSETHSVLGALVYGLEHGAVGVRVELANPNYVDAPRGLNAWAYFYEPLMPLSVLQSSKDVLRRELKERISQGDVEEVHFDRTYSRYGLLGGFMDNIVGRDGRRYPVQGARLSLQEVHGVIDAHFVQRAALGDEIRALKRKVFSGADAAIGVHYRGTDTASEYPYRKVPYAQVATRIDAALSRTIVHAKKLIAEKAAKPRAPDVRIYVATDEAPFREFIRKRYDTTESFAARFESRVTVVFNEGSPMLSASEFDTSEGLIDARLSAEFSNFDRGCSALVDAYMLAACDVIIKTRSQLSDLSLALNPDAEREVIFDIDEDSQTSSWRTITALPKLSTRLPLQVSS